jgi:hypothetical protein
VTRLPLVLLLAGLTLGCSLPTAGLTGNPTAKPSPGRLAPVEPLAGLSFKPLSAGNARFLNGNGVITSGGANVITSGGANGMAPNAGAGAVSQSAPVLGAAAPGADSMSGSAAGGASAGNGGLVSNSAGGSISNNGGSISNNGGSISNNGGSISNNGGAIASDGGVVGAKEAAVATWASGNVYGGSYADPGLYFGNAGGGAGGLALVSITEAQAPGAKGGFADVLKSVTGPVVKAWAADARLVSSSATLNGDGSLATDAPAQPRPVPMAVSAGAATVASAGTAVGAPARAGFRVQGAGFEAFNGPQAGWRLSYASTARSEVLHFFVRPDQTLVVRLRWAPIDLAPDAIAVDAAAALKKLVAAIADANTRSEEEKNGLDYFLGTPFEAAGATNGWVGEKVEPLFEVPRDARWNVSLQQILGKTVWSFNTWGGGMVYATGTGSAVAGVAVSAGTAVAVAGPSVAAGPVLAPDSAQTLKPGAVPALGSWRVLAVPSEAEPAATPKPPLPSDLAPPAPKPPIAQPANFWLSDDVQGMVDAQTGAVIRFTRPARHYYGGPIGAPTEPGVEGNAGGGLVVSPF